MRVVCRVASPLLPLCEVLWDPSQGLRLLCKHLCRLNHLFRAGLDGSEVKSRLTGGKRGHVSLPSHTCPSWVWGRLCWITAGLGLSP